MDRISGDTYADKQEEAGLMRETEKEITLLVSEATGKERFYTTKRCKEEMEVSQWLKVIGFSYDEDIEDLGKISSLAEGEQWVKV